MRWPWDRAVLKQAPHDGAIAISPDGKRLAVGGNPLQIIDLSMPEPADLLGLKLDPSAPGHPSAVAFNSDGTLLAVGRDDGVLQIWKQTENGAEKISEFRGHDNEVTALAFFHNGDLLASGSTDHRVRIWNTAPNLAPRDEADGLDPSGIISSVAFTPDGQKLVMASRTSGMGVPHSRVHVRRASTGELDRGIEGTWNITAMHLTPEGLEVIFGGREFRGRRAEGRLFWSEWHWRDEPRPRESHIVIDTFGNEVRIAVSATTGNVAMLGISPFEVMPCRIELRRSKDLARLEGDCRTVMARQIALSADGKWLAIGCDAAQFKKSGSTIQIYEMAKLEGGIRDKINNTFPEPLIVCEGRMQNLTALAFAPDGKTLVATDAAGALLLWNPHDGKQKKSLRQDKTGGVFLTLAFSKDGKQLAGGTDDGRVLIWSTEDWREGPKWTFPGSVYSLAFDPDGKRLAAGLGNGTAVILKLPLSEK